MNVIFLLSKPPTITTTTLDEFSTSFVEVVGLNPSLLKNAF
jgi:hypothetical protein